MKAALINIGRRDICKTIDVSTSNPLEDAEKEVRRFCMSSNVWLSPIGESLKEFSVNAGMQTVGKVEFSIEITKEQLDRYL